MVTISSASPVSSTPCSVLALGIANTTANTLTPKFIYDNLTFLSSFNIMGVSGCSVYDDATSGNFNLEEITGLPCGARKPVYNQYDRRQTSFRTFAISKDICGAQYKCSPYSIGDFINNVNLELQNAFVQTIYKVFLTDIVSDTRVSVLECDGSLKPITVANDSVFLLGNTTGVVDKLETALTADTVLTWLGSIVESFFPKGANINSRGVTLFVPYGFNNTIFGLLSNKNCCSFVMGANRTSYGIMQITNFLSLPLTLVSVDSSLLPPAADPTNYFRIIAVTNDAFRLYYNNKKIYDPASMVQSYNGSTSITAALINATNAALMNTMIDYRVVNAPQNTIGVALSFDAIMEVGVMRTRPKSILQLDIKKTAMTTVASSDMPVSVKTDSVTISVDGPTEVDSTHTNKPSTRR